MPDNFQIWPPKDQLSGKYIAAKWWCCRSDCALKCYQYSQKDRVDSRPCDVWMENRAQNINRNNRVNKHAGNKIRDYYNKYHPEHGWISTKEYRHYFLWNSKKAQQPGKCLA